MIQNNPNCETYLKGIKEKFDSETAKLTGPEGLTFFIENYKQTKDIVLKKGMLNFLFTDPGSPLINVDWSTKKNFVSKLEQWITDPNLLKEAKAELGMQLALDGFKSITGKNSEGLKLIASGEFYSGLKKLKQEIATLGETEQNATLAVLLSCLKLYSSKLDTSQIHSFDTTIKSFISEDVKPLSFYYDNQGQPSANEGRSTMTVLAPFTIRGDDEIF